MPLIQDHCVQLYFSYPVVCKWLTILFETGVRSMIGLRLQLPVLLAIVHTHIRATVSMNAITLLLSVAHATLLPPSMLGISPMNASHVKKKATRHALLLFN